MPTTKLCEMAKDILGSNVLPHEETTALLHLQQYLIETRNTLAGFRYDVGPEFAAGITAALAII